MIETGHPELSIRRQCELIGLNRSTFYTEPTGETTFNLKLMRLIDEQYLRTPFYGYPRMTAELRRQGYEVNRKRVARLMQKMGLQAVFPRQKLSQPAPGHNSFTWSPDDKTEFIVYHAWPPDKSARLMRIDRLTWQNGKPVIHGPTWTPQVLGAPDA